MTETKTFYALTSKYSTDYFRPERPTEVPEGSSIKAREVVWNEELEKLTEGDIWELYRRSQMGGAERVNFSIRLRSMELSDVLQALTQAGIKELTISCEWSNWQLEFRTFLRAGWKIIDSIDIYAYGHKSTCPALLLIHD